MSWNRGGDDIKLQGLLESSRMKLLRVVFITLVGSCLFATLYIISTSHVKRDITLTGDELPNSDVLSENELTQVKSAADYDSSTKQNYVFTAADLHRHYAFTTDSPQDVLVFLHMQKTGGTTFGKNLVKNLMVNNPCKCIKVAKMRCPCYGRDGKSQWLYSRYSTNWMCGLHADFTEWNECLAEGAGDELEGFHRHRRYLMFTILRNPVDRYMSEYLHTNRGATWSGATLRCNGRPNKVPFCYQNGTWEGVLLTEFLSCPFNLANNRQTRMLANLSLVNCYDDLTNHKGDEIMLKSAKENLASLPHFSLKEYPSESQFLFEHIFNIRFKQPLADLEPSTIHDSRGYYDMLKLAVQEKILANNHLDIQLYDYAKQLFFARYNYSLAMRAKSLSPS